MKKGEVNMVGIAFKIEVKFMTGVYLEWLIDIFYMDEQFYSFYKENGELVQLERETVEEIFIHKVGRKQ